VTPDDAENFCEEDEDLQEVFARYDSGPRGITGPPVDAAAQIRWGRDYIQRTYGRRS
jgi:hypothetical protein